MKKFRVVLVIALLGLALSPLLASPSEAAPSHPIGPQGTELTIDNPNTVSHHHGGGSYGRGRHRGGRW